MQKRNEERKRKKIISVAGILLMLAGSVIMSGCSGKEPGVDNESIWSDENVLNDKNVSNDEMAWNEMGVICHALGVSEDGDLRSNSLEAFLYNYEKGQRVFEADLAVTSDHVMVLRHDWSEDYGQADALGWVGEEKPIPDLETFMNARLYGKYTPLSLQDMYRLMDEYEDVWLVLDPKDTEDRYEQFAQITATARNHGYEHVLDRVIVQLYSEDMLETVQAVYPFKNYLFTMYYSGYYEGVGAFCEENGIKIVALPAGWITETVMEEQSKYPVEIWTYTVNDEETAKRLAAMGVKGLYSDALLPEEWKKISNCADGNPFLQ